MGGTHILATRYGSVDLNKDSLDKCTEVFGLLDVDQGGTIDATELGRAFQILEVEIPNHQQKKVVSAMLAFLDKDDDAEINLAEFKQLWSAYLGWRKKKDSQAPSAPFLPPVGGKHPIKLGIFLVFDDPSSCKLAQICSIFVICTIVMSVCTFVLETLPGFRQWESGRPGDGYEVATTPWFSIIEIFSITLFTIEYLARFFLVGFAPPDDTAGWKKVLSFFLHPMNLIDLIAILPFYLEMMSSTADGGSDSAFGVLRILRVARVFRVFKLGKYSTGLQMFAQVIATSISALLLLIFFLLIAVVLFGSLAYYSEKGEWNHELGGFARPVSSFFFNFFLPSTLTLYKLIYLLSQDVTGLHLELTPFTSIPASFWWVLTTSTTVGYGDMYPTSLEGKAIGLITSKF